MKVLDGSGSYDRVYFRGAKAGWVTADNDDAGLQFIFADQDAFRPNTYQVLNVLNL